jgi:hypothetical protein
MISFDDWYYSIHKNFLKSIDSQCYFVNDFYPESPFYKIQNSCYNDANARHAFLFFDQEPFYSKLFGQAAFPVELMRGNGKKFFVTSEISNDVTNFLNTINYKSIYYFFHAVAANHWYRNYRACPPKFIEPITHAFISYNNLASSFRSHRVDLLSRLYSKDLIKQGLVSFNSPGLEKLQQSIESLPDYPAQSLEIFEQQKHNLDKSLIIDQKSIHGSLSASIDLDSARSCFVQLVTETVYYQNKLHLTEKVFKPIVTGQPFLLLAAPNNLKYLKSYGFKTFGAYWDENYDSMLDPADRMAAVVNITEQLCNKPLAELEEMRRDMQDILEHNYRHFYYDLVPLVITEFINNLESALKDADIAYNKAELTELYQILTY